MQNQLNRSKLFNIINEMLAPYQIDLDDIREYPNGNIDGAPWYVYFCVPFKVQFDLFKKHKLSTWGWLETPTEQLECNALKARLKDSFLIDNRLKIINSAYGEYYKDIITVPPEWDSWNELRASISDSPGKENNPSG